nr:RecName: Full=Unknown protein from spot 907 of 2D-PAGE of etiolated coleoptile [Zea mays]
AEPRDQFK